MSNSTTSRLTQADVLFADAIAKLRPGDVAIDCGANVGKFTLEMAETGAEVYAFEPDELLVPIINRKVSGYPNVRVFNAAVGTLNGKIKLLRSKNYHNNQARESKNNTTMSKDIIFSNSKTSKTFEDGDVSEVDLINLPEFIREKIDTHGHISLLKVDIEGAEVELMECLLAHRIFDNIDMTVVETHEFLFPDLVDRYAALRAAVRQHYSLEKVNFDWR